MLVVGAVLLLASLPVFLIGLALLLNATTSLSLPAGFGLSGAIGASAAAALLYASLRDASFSAKEFETSAGECRKNVDWLRATVSGR